MINLVKFVAASGAASRRQAEMLIKNGRVAINGSAVCDPARRVQENDSVTLDGKPVTPAEKFFYILLHKPRGYVCSNADAHAELLAVDLLSSIPARLFSAGRLDKDSEGAIIFSNDGEFINRLTHPRYGILKQYKVYTAAELSADSLKRMVRGLNDDGEFLQAKAVRPVGSKCYEVILNEGKKREIRRLTAACGAPTVRLIRKNIGGIALGDLPAGKFRELTPAEVAMLKGETDA
jgi:23S rRNA pseudouridine2605 synthase